MQAYGHTRTYRADSTIHAGQPEPRKQAPKGADSAKRKAARQQARNDIKEAVFH